MKSLGVYSDHTPVEGISILAFLILALHLYISIRHFTKPPLIEERIRVKTDREQGNRVFGVKNLTFDLGIWHRWRKAH